MSRMVEPIDGDALSQWIYSAGAEPFLARELADSVLHFLRDEGGDSAELRDLAARVVRELGHPRLARALETQADDAADDAAYPANLRAAHDAGLLRIDDPDDPGRLLAGGVGGPQPGAELDWLRVMDNVRRRFRRYAVVADVTAAWEGNRLADLADLLRLGARVSGLPAVVNLAAVETRTETERGLFDEFDGAPSRAERLRRGLDLLAAQPDDADLIYWHWHIGADDLNDPDLRALVRRACCAVVNRPHWAFIFDRSAATDPAVLELVSMDLRMLLRHVRSSVHTPADFLAKLGSLARLALAVGQAKRRWLHRHGPPELRGGFVPERASLVITPFAIAEVAAELYGEARPTAVGAIRDALWHVLKTESNGMPVTLTPPDWPSGDGHDAARRIDLTDRQAVEAGDAIDGPWAVVIDRRHPLAAERIQQMLDAAAAQGCPAVWIVDNAPKDRP